MSTTMVTGEYGDVGAVARAVARAVEQIEAMANTRGVSQLLARSVETARAVYGTDDLREAFRLAVQEGQRARTGPAPQVAGIIRLACETAYHGTLVVGAPSPRGELQVPCRGCRTSRDERVTHRFDLATGQLLGTVREPRS